VADGARTHDHWNHNPGLYQLSYSHRSNQIRFKYAPCKSVFGTPGRIRTCGHPLRRRMLYPAELRAHCWILTSKGLKKVVGVEGFEPPTFCSQSRRATGLRYTPTRDSLFVLRLEEVRIIPMGILLVNKKSEKNQKIMKFFIFAQDLYRSCCKSIRALVSPFICVQNRVKSYKQVFLCITPNYPIL
jgi:hypothetical protein